MDLVKVSWVDSFSFGGWMDAETASEMKPSEIESVGYAVQNDDQRIVIAQSLGSGSVANVLAIPKIAVTNLEEI